MAERRTLDDHELEFLFAAARESTTVPTDALLERIMKDAGKQADIVAAATGAPKRGLLGKIPAAVGEIPAMVGLLSATAAGMAIGYFAAAPIDELSGAYLAGALGYTLEDIMPSFLDLIGET